MGERAGVVAGPPWRRREALGGAGRGSEGSCRALGDCDQQRCVRSREGGKVIGIADSRELFHTMSVLSGAPRRPSAAAILVVLRPLTIAGGQIELLWAANCDR
jgi:hypothetical protein